MKSILLFILLALYMSCKQKAADVLEASTKTPEETINPVMARFAKMEAEALKEPYKGIFTASGRPAGLYPIKATGVSTREINQAAEEFLNSLTPEQLERTTFTIDDKEWRKWSNVDNGIYKRHGVSLKEMTPSQKERAYHLMQVALSAKGMQLSRDIMKTDHTLKEINKGSADFDEELYFFTLMGTPSPNQPWGWQLDGHHLIINYFILGIRS